MKALTEAKVGRLARKALDMQREADHLCAEVEKLTGCEKYDGTIDGEIAEHFHAVSASLEMAMQEISTYADNRGYQIRWR